MLKTTTTTTRPNRPAKAKKKPATTTTVVTTKQPRQRKAKARVPNSAASAWMRSYINTLMNPWQYPAVKLGFGCYVPTVVGTAIIRSAITANADGSLLLIGKTNATVPIMYSNAATGAAPSFVAITDGVATTAINSFDSARPVSFGVRVTPISAANDKSSRAVGGCFAYSDTSLAANPTTFNAVPHSQWYGSHHFDEYKLASGGIESADFTWRPMDGSSFQFSEDFIATTANSPTTGFPLRGPVVVVAIAGPNAQVYEVDIVLRYEGLPNVGSLFSGTQPAAPSSGTEGATWFPSLDSMYKTAQNILGTQTGRESIYNAMQVGTTAFDVYSSVRGRRGPSALPWYGGVD